RGEEVEELEDEADLPAPEDRDLVVAHPRDRGAADDDLPLGGLVEAAQQMEQRALARAAGTDHGHELSGRDVERHPAQRADVGLTMPEDRPYAAQGDHVGNGPTWTQTTGLLRVKQALKQTELCDRRWTPRKGSQVLE